MEPDFDEFITEVRARKLALGITDADFEGCDNAGLQRCLLRPSGVRAQPSRSPAASRAAKRLGSLSRTDACPGDAGMDASLDHAALKLGEHAHHAEHGPARRRCRVDDLLVQEQVHLGPVKLL